MGTLTGHRLGRHGLRGGVIVVDILATLFEAVQAEQHPRVFGILQLMNAVQIDAGGTSEVSPLCCIT